MIYFTQARNPSVAHPADVEDVEELVAHVPVQVVRLALLVAEQRPQQSGELVAVQAVVPESG